MLLNPYPDGSRQSIRLSADIHADDYNYIRRILVTRPRGGVQATANILWKKLIDELKRRNISPIPESVDAFEQFVTRSILVLPGELGRDSAGESDAGKPVPTVGQPTERVGETTPGTPDEPHNLPPRRRTPRRRGSAEVETY